MLTACAERRTCAKDCNTAEEASATGVGGVIGFRGRSVAAVFFVFHAESLFFKDVAVCFGGTLAAGYYRGVTGGAVFTCPKHC
jgi:hypothetical protein